jgi:hypothetical protein
MPFHQPATTSSDLISLPLSLGAAWQLWRNAREPARLRPSIGLTIAAGVLHGLGMAGGLVSMGWR